MFPGKPFVPNSSKTSPRNPRRRVRLRVVTGRGSSLTVNVSAGGFCTALMRVLPMGAPIDGLIHVDGRDAFFSGRVVWVKPGDPRLNVMGKMGVRFDSIDPAAAKGLAGSDSGSAAA
jgi:hypothetical protein